jgi:hypothetical protein
MAAASIITRSSAIIDDAPEALSEEIGEAPTPVKRPTKVSPKAAPKKALKK